MLIVDFLSIVLEKVLTLFLGVQIRLEDSYMSTLRGKLNSSSKPSKASTNYGDRQVLE